MAGALAQQIKFTSSVALPRNQQSDRCTDIQNTVKMVCSLKTSAKMTCSVPIPPLRMSGFFGLRGSSTLDNLVKSGQTLHSKVVTATSIGRRGNRVAPKAMFENYSNKSIEVLMAAQDEARRLGQNYVGPGKILLGLFGDGTSITAKVLKSVGINLKDARVEVENIIGRGSDDVYVDIPFTRGAKRVLELTQGERRKLDHGYVRPEHLLLGLLSEGDSEGVASRVFKNLGVEPSNISEQVFEMITLAEEKKKRDSKLEEILDRMKTLVLHLGRAVGLNDHIMNSIVEAEDYDENYVEYLLDKQARIKGNDNTSINGDV